jgi:hypothetical protein
MVAGSRLPDENERSTEMLGFFIGMRSRVAYPAKERDGRRFESCRPGKMRAKETERESDVAFALVFCSIYPCEVVAENKTNNGGKR